MTLSNRASERIHIKSDVYAAACDELAARHGVAVKDSLFDVLGAGNGTVAKAAVVRFCQLDALAHGHWISVRRGAFR